LCRQRFGETGTKEPGEGLFQIGLQVLWGAMVNHTVVGGDHLL
jgi:hypothetical protein